MGKSSAAAGLLRAVAIGFGVISMMAGARMAHAQVSVGNGGAPGYSKAISVPPGVGGMAPKLSITYVGGNVDGPLGYGWSLSGLSVINRCTATAATDGRRAGVSYGPNDKLCLDGQRLIQTDPAGAVNPPPTYDATGKFLSLPQSNDANGLAAGAVREFRTERNSYARIRAYGYANGDSTGASGPAFFRVWTKAGQIYDYGASPNVDANSRGLIAAPGKPPIVWALVRMSDARGNRVDFKYDQRDIAWGSGPQETGPYSGHEWNIAEIQYGTNKVVFNYDMNSEGADARPDRYEAYHLGLKTLSLRRFASITTYVNSSSTSLGANGGLPVSTIKMGYEAAPVSGRSRLTSIAACAGGPASTKCLPAATFGYANQPEISFHSVAKFNSDPLSSFELNPPQRDGGTLVGDFNGDGRSDILYWSNDPSKNQLFLSNGDGSFTRVSPGTGPGQFNLADTNLFFRPALTRREDNCFMSMVSDFNGDGLADILRWASPTANGMNGGGDGYPCPAGGQTFILQSKGDGSFTKLVPQLDTSGAPLALARLHPTQVTGSDAGPGANFYLGDFDGDGKIDLLEVYSGKFSFNTAANAWLCTSQPCYSQISFGKGNGRFSSPVPTGFPPGYIDPLNDYFIFVRDIDGDGADDLFVRGPTDSQGNATPYVAYISDRTGRLNPYGGVGGVCGAPEEMVFLDVNGDRYLDFLCPRNLPSAPANSLYVSNGGLGFFKPKPTLEPGSLELNGEYISTSSISDGFASVKGANSNVIDINADGRGDILRFSDDAQQNAVFLSRGDGSFTKTAPIFFDGLPVQVSNKATGTSFPLVADFLGNGSVQILKVNRGGPNVLYALSNVGPTDKLVRVVSEYGVITDLYYAPLSSSRPVNGISADLGDRYNSDRGNTSAAIADSVDLTTPTYVVVTKVEDSGVGAARLVEEYSYAGFKVDRRGRAELGFRKVARQRQGADGSSLTTETQFLQVFPYIGRPFASATFLGTLGQASAATRLGVTEYAYCDKTSASAPSTTGQCLVTASVVDPYLYWSSESSFDLKGLPLSTVKTNNDFNSTGDPTRVSVEIVGPTAGITQTFTKSSSYTYLPDDVSCVDTMTCNWVLGRVREASVTSTVPDSILSIASSPGSAPNATAINGMSVAARLTFNPAAVGFGAKSVNGSYPSDSITLRNSGSIGATGLRFSVPAGFAMANNSCGTTLTSGGSCTFTVIWTPAQAQNYSGSLSVAADNGVVIDNALALSGSAYDAPTLSSVNLASSTLTVGSSTQLSWTAGGDTVSSAVSCTGSLSGSGSSSPVTVSAPAVGAGSCTVTATNGAGAQVTAQVNASVVAAPSVSSASFSPASVVTGNTSNFSWSTANATSASVSCAAPASGTATGTSGTLSVMTSGTGTGSCTVTANNAAGATATGSANLAVTPPATVISTASFGAPNVTANGSVGFSWTASNATTTSVSCSGAISGSGTGTGTGGSITATAGASAGSGVCTVTATGAGGTIERQSTVNVVLPPSVGSASFSSSSVTSGASSIFSWATGNATSASVSCAPPASGSGFGTSGSISVSTSGSGTGSCTVTATNAAGTTAIASANLAVLTPPNVTFSGSTSSTTTTPTAATVSLSFSNIGQTATTLNLSVSGGSSLNVSTVSCPASSNCSSTVIVTSPTGVGTYNGYLTVTSSAGGSSPVPIQLNLQVNNPTPPSLQLASCAVTSPTTAPTAATAVCALSNTGQTATSVTYGFSPFYNGQLPPSISGPSSCAANSSCGNVTVSTGSSGYGNVQGTLSVYANPGTGTSTNVNLSMQASPPNVSYSGAINASSTSPTAASGTVTFSNSGQTSTTLTLSVTGGGSLSTTSVSCPAGGACSPAVTVTSPTVAGSYSGSLSVSSSNSGTLPAPIPVTLSVAAAPPSVSSGFNVSTITMGGGATFSWSASNATSTSASCSGAVSGSGSGSASSGSITATAGSGAGVGTCIASASGPGGTQTSQATVNVVLAPSVSAAAFSSTSVAAGSSSTFSWTTANATSASVSCSGAGATASGSGTSGSINVGTTASGTASCTVTALNAAGTTATGGATLTVNAASAVVFTSTLSGTTWTFTNPNSTAQTITSLGLQFTGSRAVGASISGGTCAANGSVAAGGTCTVIVNAPTPDCRANNYSVAPLLKTAAGTADVYWVSRTSTKTVCP